MLKCAVFFFCSGSVDSISAEDPGRPDIYVEGLDRNRDGIPDILQQARVIGSIPRFFDPKETHMNRMNKPHQGFRIEYKNPNHLQTKYRRKKKNILIGLISNDFSCPQ